MKKLFIGLVILTAIHLGCHNRSSSYNGKDTVNARVGDTSRSHELLPPPSSNSDATNPSIPDTSILHSDSPARKKVVY